MARVTRRQAAAANASQSAAPTTPPASTAAANGADPSLPLDGCVVALSGTFPSLSHATLQKQLTALGAKFARSVTAATTHLVSNKEDFAKDSSKVVAAKANNVTIVDIEWALKAIEDDGRPAEDDYSLQAVKKRPIAIAKSDPSADASEDDDSTQKPKKRKTAKDTKSGKATKATKAAKVKDETPEPEEPKKKAKKEKQPVAEGQIAKSANLVVPVDELFHVSGKTGFVVYIDSDGVIYDASLNQTNASNNNNKFYKVQV
jgi:poly [ADP-ribose] polymerase